MPTVNFHLGKGRTIQPSTVDCVRSLLRTGVSDISRQAGNRRTYKSRAQVLIVNLQMAVIGAAVHKDM
ncbi:hypothetical protein ALQ93_102025 [Pseudomonas syringae pv. pisi]|uniref:Uncharacterized protein n=2 Tax=Pseudomonas syringae group TaxID=136849 RepID=A0A3M4Y7S4_9PSED|nr:hypothetical protein ALQ93_102025 [Pseudomonas syringae pv. pisi]RMR83972.1 hypothetical protein ALP78_101941 [Pseudomonas coronafaciens pv. striafaciens]RMU86856.1 hypothetical protein ALP21_101747 [Pseudomonas savastanoi pv. phaseolicola]RMM16994.1 hypothetical protein ALQ82_101685 [Pseudomonas syringae pv. pisi]RMM18180.1 hypothetical protein ALQ81_101844 [Pseudomonas syringae pv. pisi]